MTAVMTVATVAGPVGFFASRYALRWLSVQQLFVVVAAALTAGGLAFAAVALRSRGAEAPADPVAA